jgi:hypothetical protein
MGALLVAFITSFVQPMAAQESRATVRGVITDPTHAVVPGAKVTLHNVGTNVDRVKEADPSGFYVFDRVISGNYSLSVEATGFQKFVQENIRVQATGDVTVNAVLTLGSVTQTVEVTAAVGQVEFNTSTMSTTVQQSFLKDLPILARNPFTLAMLDAGVVNQYWDIAHRLPFYMWSDGEMDIGGPTSTRVEDIIDGVRTDIGGGRGTINLSMDAVQEVVVQQNIPDAEHGFSAGGAINITSKSGTNDFHGSAYVFTRQPKWNALSNRITRAPDIVKQNIYGFTVGNPVIKNKLFNFFAWEHWYATQPSSKEQTMPTAAERAGDFSQAIQNNGQMRVIYDPTTTQFNPITNVVTRTPISCNGKANVICPSAIDPTAALLMPYLWYPNTTPDTPDGMNNFKITYPWWTKYHNLHDRVDYNLSDKWRMYAHYSEFRTRLDNVNWSAGYMNGGPPSIATPSDNGGIMDATSSAMDVLYMPNPRTTLDIRFGSNYEDDDYNSTWAKVPISVWAGLWPDASYPWYVPINNPAVGIYFPNIGWCGIGCPQGNTPYTGYGEWWYDHQREYEPSITLTHEVGKHHMKFGWWHRYEWAQNFELAGPAANWSNVLAINSVDTAASWLGYTPDASGDQWASTLLGVVDSASAEIKPTVDQIHVQMDAFFIQDDFRLRPRITLNVGLRYEHETGPGDNNHWLIRTLDTHSAIPNWPTSTFNLWTPQVLAAANLPASAANIPSLVAPLYYGQAVRTTASNPRMYDAQKFTLLPRVGVAYRLNDKTALRLGYSRFAEAQVSLRSEETYDPSNGYDQQTLGLGPLVGIPRSYLKDPFPMATAYPNPIRPAVGTALGPYQDLGNSWSYWSGLKTPIDDRFNFNIQRQLPGQFRLDATEYLFFSRNAQQCGNNYCVTYNINQMNPLYNYLYKGLLSTSVPNPFYGVFPTSLAQAGVASVTSSYTGLPIMPGLMGTTSTTTLSQLLQPYPQYGSLNVYGWPGQAVHYYGTAISLSRPMAHGIAFLGTYNYSLQSIGGFYDDFTTYNQQWQLFDRGLPRHNIRLTGTYQLPFGKGRTFLSNAPRWLDEVVGGWATSNIFYWTSGTLDSFGSQIYGGMICDPRQNIPAGEWFNANCLITPPAYTMANSPLYYEGLRGPKFWQLDTTAVKNFKVTERVNLEFRVEMYNMPNIFIPSNPNICGPSQCGSSAGISTWVASASTGANYGRELQCQVHLQF